MLSPVAPRILPDRDQINDWYLDQDVTITLTNGHTHTIRKGFKFDSHSVPWWARWVFPRYCGQDVYAALVHDYLVACEHWLPYSRYFVDRQYAFFMRMYQVKKSRTFWMPKAVYTWNALYYYWRDYRGRVPEKMHVDIQIKIKSDS